ncbi:Hsp20/alpha crystallin family protein [Spirillospora sp. NPDC047279]|uniref:Hsp20/alpha crystallin family protein n=1 Tax=Spirillospora sp. NPDC047279 TaxID=3155478 RepID=UPI0033C6116A
MSTLEFLEPKSLLPELGGWPEEPFVVLRTPAGMPVRLEHRIEHGDYVVRAELADLAPEDLEITVARNVLGLHAERHEPEGEDAQRPSIGSFTWSLVLPTGIDPERVRTKYDQGVLTVKVAVPDTGTHGERAGG